jgi:hypothetical protein
MLEGIDGAEGAKDALKALFQADDKKLQDQIDANGTLKSEMGELKASFNDFKSSNAGAIPKTEMEKLKLEFEGRIKGLEEKNTAAEEKASNLEMEKRSGELSSHFTSAVLDSFGSKNAEMAVGYGMANGSISYGEDGAMGYNGKFGDDAIEAFKTDNSHLIQNRGTGTSGGESSSSSSSNFVDSLREQMLRD